MGNKRRNNVRKPEHIYKFRQSPHELREFRQSPHELREFDELNEMMKLNQEDYIEVERDNRKKYVEMFGEGTLVDSFRSFSEEEQIDRYAKNILFWEDLYPVEIKSKYDLVQKQISGNCLLRMIQKVEEMFPDIIIRKISNEIYNMIQVSKPNEKSKSVKSLVLSMFLHEHYQ